MKVSPCSVLFLVLLSACFSASGQQSATHPVLSASPAAPAAAQTAAAPPAGNVTVDASYVIGAEDSLQITVWKEPSLSNTLPVRPDGMISLPLVGDIMAAGLTPTKLKENITVELRKFVTDPDVGVSVLAVNSKRIYMVGEVGHVGPLSITPGMNVLQAIATAGGLSPYAKRKSIYILRGPPGKQQKILFDYNKAVKNGNMQGVLLLPGDTVVAP